METASQPLRGDFRASCSRQRGFHVVYRSHCDYLKRRAGGMSSTRAAQTSVFRAQGADDLAQEGGFLFVLGFGEGLR